MKYSMFLMLSCDAIGGGMMAGNRIARRFVKTFIIPALPRCCKFRVY